MQIERSAIETHYWNYYANASVGDEELVFLRKLGYGRTARYEKRKIVAMRASALRHQASSDKTPERVRHSFDSVRIKADGTEGQHFRNDYMTYEQEWASEGGQQRFDEIREELQNNVLLAYGSREQIGVTDNE